MTNKIPPTIAAGIQIAIDQSIDDCLYYVGENANPEWIAAQIKKSSTFGPASWAKVIAGLAAAANAALDDDAARIMALAAMLRVSK